MYRGEGAVRREGRLEGSYLPLFALVLLTMVVLATAEASSNLCTRHETYEVPVPKSVRRPYVIREYVWCMAVPPRCPKVRTEYRTETTIEMVIKTRVLSECCDGYAMLEDSCVPVCAGLFSSDACGAHGSCVAPNVCRCEPGFHGGLCQRGQTTTVATTTIQDATTKFPDIVITATTSTTTSPSVNNTPSTPNNTPRTPNNTSSTPTPTDFIVPTTSLPNTTSFTTPAATTSSTTSATSTTTATTSNITPTFTPTTIPSNTPTTPTTSIQIPVITDEDLSQVSEESYEDVDNEISEDTKSTKTEYRNTNPLTTRITDISSTAITSIIPSQHESPISHSSTLTPPTHTQEPPSTYPTEEAPMKIVTTLNEKNLNVHSVTVEKGEKGDIAVKTESSDTVNRYSTISNTNTSIKKKEDESVQVLMGATGNESKEFFASQKMDMVTLGIVAVGASTSFILLSLLIVLVCQHRVSREDSKTEQQQQMQPPGSQNTLRSVIHSQLPPTPTESQPLSALFSPNNNVVILQHVTMATTNNTFKPRGSGISEPSLFLPGHREILEAHYDHPPPKGSLRLTEAAPRSSLSELWDSVVNAAAISYSNEEEGEHLYDEIPGCQSQQQRPSLYCDETAGCQSQHPCSSSICDEILGLSSSYCDTKF